MLIKLLFSLFIPLSLSALDYSPWYNKIFELEGKAAAEFQWGSSTQLFRNELGLKVTPWTNIRTEVEFSLFSSKRHSYSPESFQFLGQYRFMDDISGDPISLTSGLTLIFPFNKAKYTRALFYPGSTEAEVHITLGKEATVARSWFDRYWVYTAVGFSNQSSPWWRTHLEYNRNFFPYCEGGIFARTLLGARTRAVELGIKGVWLLENFLCDVGHVTLTYFIRPYAHFLPHVSSIKIEYASTF